MPLSFRKKNATMRILVYHAGTLGDTIVALPAFWAVRKHFPDAYLALLSNHHPGTNYVSPPEVLPRTGLFDEYILYQASIYGTNPKDLLPVLLKLRQRHFSTLVYLSPRKRARWRIWRDVVFFRISGITQFIGCKGFEPLPRSPVRPLPLVMHEADHLLKRLAHDGIPVPPPGHGCMDLALTDEEIAEAQGWIRSQVGLGHRECLVGIGPSSKWPSKVWPEERYKVLGRCLIEKLSIFPVVFGGPEDTDIGNRLIADWNIGVNAAGKLSVRQAAAVLSFCRLYVGNDSGIMHLAAAVGTPCVGIFSAQDWPGKWYPYGNKNVVLRRSVPCEGCQSPQCPKGSLECLMQISVADVLFACKSLLSS